MKNFGQMINWSSTISKIPRVGLFWDTVINLNDFPESILRALQHGMTILRMTQRDKDLRVTGSQEMRCFRLNSFREICLWSGNARMRIRRLWEVTLHKTTVSQAQDPEPSTPARVTTRREWESGLLMNFHFAALFTLFTWLNPHEKTLTCTLWESRWSLWGLYDIFMLWHMNE